MVVGHGLIVMFFVRIPVRINSCFPDPEARGRDAVHYSF